MEFDDAYKMIHIKKLFLFNDIQTAQKLNPRNFY